MSKPRSLVAVVVVVFSLALIAVGRAADADPTVRKATIQIIERAVDLSFQDAAPPGPSIGDRFVLTSDLFDGGGRKVGRDGGECVLVRVDPTAPPADQQLAHCTITVELPEGQITFQGLPHGTRNYFAVTGGTGAYRSARGQALVVDVAPLQEADITIELDP